MVSYDCGTFGVGGAVSKMICYLCESDVFSVRDGAVRDDPSLDILECASCGLVTLSRLDHIALGHYEDAKMHGAAPPSIEAWLRESAKDDQHRFEMLRSDLTNRRVLDFGCGAGGFILKARQCASTVCGVEPEQRIRQYWRDKLVIYPSLEDVERDYHLITAFHVVEHLLDPRKTLAQLAGLLTDGGRIVIEVPSSEDALLTLFECEAFQNFTYWSQHAFLFNANTLGRLAAQAGLRVRTIRQFQRYPLSNHLLWLSQGLPGDTACGPLSILRH